MPSSPPSLAVSTVYFNGSMFYLHDAIEGAISSSSAAENGLDDVESYYDGDEDEFGSISSQESEDGSLPDHTGHRPRDVGPPDAPPAPPAFGAQYAPAPSNFPPTHINAPAVNNPNNNADEPSRPIPKGKSIAHHDLNANNVVFCSLDLETGGEYVGIIQLSAEISRRNPVDPLKLDYIREPETFNMYVRPPDGTYWNEEACRRSHGLTPQSPQIQSASPFISVWTHFCDWIARHVGPDEKCILIAYRGETCDMRWIWKHTQAPRSQLCIPPQIVYFMDPLEVINNYTTCPYHPKRSKLESLEAWMCLEVYHHATKLEWCSR